MKILSKSIKKRDGSGFVQLVAEEDEDMYHLYKLIEEDDVIDASTVRNVVSESKSGSKEKSRKQIRMSLAVEKVEFDAEQCALRVKGRNQTESDNIKMGQYHTIEIELGRPVRIHKRGRGGGGGGGGGLMVRSGFGTAKAMKGATSGSVGAGARAGVSKGGYSSSPGGKAGLGDGTLRSTTTAAAVTDRGADDVGAREGECVEKGGLLEGAGGWDGAHLELLDEASNPTRRADVCALVMQEGLAHLCLIKAAMTKVCAKIEKSMPNKKKQAKNDNALDVAQGKFFEAIYMAIKKHVDFEVVKVFLVGSPGFLNEDFMIFLADRAMKDENSTILKNRSKFLKVHTTCGHKRAIDEMLGDPQVMTQLNNVKAADEVKALQLFYDTLTADPDRACYGYSHVLAACDQLAIEELLVTDTLYLSGDYTQRTAYNGLIERVRDVGGKVFKFSSLHVSGEQLNLYTGVAATLRFPIPEMGLHVDGNDGRGETTGVSGIGARHDSAVAEAAAAAVDEDSSDDESYSALAASFM